jgi:hypothetical protein
MASETKTKSKTNWALYAILGLIAGVIGCVIYKHYGSSIMPAPSTAAKSTNQSSPVATETKNATGMTKMTAAEQSWYCANHPNSPGCDKVNAISWNCKNHPNAPGCDKVKQKGAVVMNRSTSWAS